MTKKFTLIFMLLCVVTVLHAKEGMWMPLFLDKYNIEEMQQRGFKLTADDVYSINNASMKDAVVIFNGGCTGEIVSENGLLLTNHHCGYSAIQKLSSLENNYLADGFWAMSKSEELANEDLSVLFLREMRDVTELVLKDIDDKLSFEKKQIAIRKNIKKLIESEKEQTGFNVEIESFFYGLQYFMFFYEEFKDVRLVGTPPSSIGKFGSDLDNWMWPRHTGDFSIFRIYADVNNKPAEYSTENVPYKPNYYFPISLNGVQENDFTMIFGFPGSTKQYVPSFHISMLKDVIYPMLIDVRTEKLDVYKNEMRSDANVKIQYASKSATVSNAWKKWQGEIRGLNILDAVNKKVEQEKEFIKWANEDENRKIKYGNVIEDFEKVYKEFQNYEAARSVMLELIGRNGIEVSSFIANLSLIVYDAKTEDDYDSAQIEMTELSEKFFKDYSIKIDKKVSSLLLNRYKNYISENLQPKLMSEVESKYKGDFEKYIEEIFKKTIFTDKQKVSDFIKLSNKKQLAILKKDPLLKMSEDLRTVYYNVILEESKDLQSRLEELNQLYMQGLMEFASEKIFYPDANFTLRVGYGRVKGYKAKDAVYHDYYTTLDGVIEKNAIGDRDYEIPFRLKELYKNKDYSVYAQNGEVPVCFVATNHTTGGNSGSPVVNGKGELIGINFDRAWEGVMSDMMFNPEQCRNISVDIRYVLFIIEKLGDAGYLLDEMNIVK